TVLETPVAETFADGDRVTAATGDVFRQSIANDLGPCRAAVHVQPQTRRAAGAVAGYGDVDPFIHKCRLDCTDGCGVARPEMNERPLQPALFEQQLVAAAGG